VRFWVLTVLVPLASPESPPPASSDHRRSSPASVSLTSGTRSSAARAGGRPSVGRAREQAAGGEWAALLDWATLSR
jgi:hypothetical protein